MKLTHFFRLIESHQFSLLRKLFAYWQYKRHGYFTDKGWKVILIVD